MAQVDRVDCECKPGIPLAILDGQPDKLLSAAGLRLRHEFFYRHERRSHLTGGFEKTPESIFAHRSDITTITHMERLGLKNACDRLSLTPDELFDKVFAPELAQMPPTNGNGHYEGINPSGEISGEDEQVDEEAIEEENEEQKVSRFGEGMKTLLGGILLFPQNQQYLRVELKRHGRKVNEAVISGINARMWELHKGKPLEKDDGGMTRLMSYLADFDSGDRETIIRRLKDEDAKLFLSALKDLPPGRLADIADEMRFNYITSYNAMATGDMRTRR